MRAEAGIGNLAVTFKNQQLVVLGQTECDYCLTETKPPKFQVSNSIQNSIHKLLSRPDKQICASFIFTRDCGSTYCTCLSIQQTVNSLLEECRP